MGSSSSVVISFSIAILLLLILLLLLSYNSKSKQVDKFERFESPPAAYDNYNNYNELFTNNIYANSPSLPTNAPAVVATKNTDVDKINGGLGEIAPADTSYDSYTNYNNTTESFTNLSTTSPTEACRDPITCGYKRDQLTAKELLPADATDLKWSQTNPTGSAEIVDQGLLTAGYHIGLNQVCKKNANLQLRSEVPNPQYAVSPWMISTIDNCRDMERNFEIGSSAPSV